MSLMGFVAELLTYLLIGLAACHMDGAPVAVIERARPKNI